MQSNHVSRRDALALLGAGAVLPVAGCGGGGAEVVEVGPDGDPVFRPGTEEPLEITTGTTVRFVWESNGHNIHVDSQPETADWQGHGSIEDEGFEHEHTFEVAGQYHYWCEPHRSAGMVADVVVESGDGGGGVY